MEPHILALLIIRDLAFPVLGIAGGVFLLAKTDLGRRLFGTSSADESREIEALRNEIQDLRYQLEETQERLDFTERLLTRQAGENLTGSRTTRELTPV